MKNQPSVEPKERLLTSRDLCRRWGISQATLGRLRGRSKVPKPIAIGRQLHSRAEDSSERSASALGCLLLPQRGRQGQVPPRSPPPPKAAGEWLVKRADDA